MPDTNPYGEPIAGLNIGFPASTPLGVVRDRGQDPRHVIAATLRIVSRWHECDYRLIADEIDLMHPDDPECAFCGYEECENGCPMMRWRGQG